MTPSTPSEGASGRRPVPADPRPEPAGNDREEAPEYGSGSAGAEEDPVDPPALPRLDDPFELARRTVNRSRAAARDRGLFPISAKTQARDVRDRSSRSRGTPARAPTRATPRASS